MKKAILFISIICFSFGLFSQEYIPLIEEGNTWNVLSVVYIPGDPYHDTINSTIAYKVSGETTINAVVYKNLLESREEFPSDWTHFAYMREDDQRRVWMLRDSEEGEFLMYDFNAVAGDTVSVGYSESVPLVLDSITQVEVNGLSRSKYWLSYGDYYRETWVTGIGSNKGIWGSGSTFVVGGWYWLLCMFDAKGIVYDNPVYESCFIVTGIEDVSTPVVRIFPNPAHDYVSISLPLQINLKEIDLINVLGEVVERLNLPEKSSRHSFSHQISNLSREFIFIE